MYGQDFFLKDYSLVIIGTKTQIHLNPLKLIIKHPKQRMELLIRGPKMVEMVW